MKTLSERLIQEREAKGWSQPELARRVGIAQSFIGALESQGQMSSGWLPEIAHALGVDAYWLKTGKGIRIVTGVQLSDEQVTLLKGFALFDKSLQDNWIENAQRAIDKDAAAKKVSSSADAATNKAA